MISHPAIRAIDRRQAAGAAGLFAGLADGGPLPEPVATLAVPGLADLAARWEAAAGG